jgi:hypothetical protein
LDSDLRAFAGIAGEVRPSRVQARITCVAEIHDLGIEQSQRMAAVLGAPFMAHHADRGPVHLTTAYDPEASSLKAVLIAGPADAAGWLRLLETQLENFR